MSGAPVTSTSTCRSARTAAATATSSRSSAGREGHGAYVDALLAELELERGAARAASSRPSSWAAARRRSPSRRSSPACSRRFPWPPRSRSRRIPRPSRPELAALLRDARSHARLARRAELPAGSARRARAPRGPDAVRRASTIFVMPDLTTSRSTSSTAFPARAPPISSATLMRRSRSGPSTSPATSSRRSPEPASPTRTARSSRGRPRRWRATSSWSSRRSSPRATAGTRRRTSAGRAAAGAQHNLGYWLGRDYLGLGIGAVSTVGELRWRNRPEPGALPAARSRAGRRPPREEELDAQTSRARAPDARPAARRAAPARGWSEPCRPRRSRPHRAARPVRRASGGLALTAPRALPGRRRHRGADA